jgi:hypothetical protein
MARLQDPVLDRVMQRLEHDDTLPAAGLLQYRQMLAQLDRELSQARTVQASPERAEVAEPAQRGPGRPRKVA